MGKNWDMDKKQSEAHSCEVCGWASYEYQPQWNRFENRFEVVCPKCANQRRKG